MAFHRSLTAFQQRLVGPITLTYQRLIQSGQIHLDHDQLSLGAALDSLYFQLSSPASHRFLIPDDHLDHAARYYAGSSPAFSSFGNLAGIAVAAAHSLVHHSSPKGIYIHGSVGVGKSMLMDLFYQTCSSGLVHDTNDEIQYNPIQRRCKRRHFHEFMLDVHQRIHTYKKMHPRADPLPPVAAALAKEARLLCFDEMQITDIADAMILKRLLTLLFDLGVTIVTTSNRPPCGLYEGGINRSIFLPFIDKLRERMTVVKMGGMRDYRQDAYAMTYESNKRLVPSYLFPSSDHSTLTILEQWYKTGRGETRSEVIPVAMGRSICVPKANDSCGWFSFDELCKQPLGAADYIALANRFSLIIIDNVPQLGGNTYNESRRFVVLIDALYEAKTKLIVSANVPRDDLFVGFDATVETSDGDEEIAMDGNRSGKESLVVKEGGSSNSSSTTLIRPADNAVMEWSATGRIGVSLAQLSAVKEVSFSFRRAASRLAEMTAANWGRSHIHTPTSNTREI
ncbi:hypothetical protein ACHAW6_015932 [Cyclotella cf. meneghiniana]